MPTTLVSPMNEAARPQGRPARRLGSLEGRKIALLDISKPGGSDFLDEVALLLGERHATVKIVRRSKPTFARPAPDSLVDDLLEQECDAVIEALAD